MNRNLRRAIAALAAAGALGACTKAGNGTTSAGSNSWTVPGVLSFSEVSDPKNLNVVLNSASPTLDLSMFIFSYTVRYDNTARPFPDAVTEIPTIANGDVSKDGLTLTYKLRPNIKWQDGQPLTCNDLKFTWRVVMNPHNNVVTTDGYKDIGSIDCSDPHVALVHMKRLYAPFLQQLWSENGNAPILPEHLLAKYNDDKGSFNTAPYNSLPVGSGPFKVVAWNRGQDVRLVANPDFYLGAPKLKEVIYKILPDENTAVTQLQTHELDMLALGSGLKWPEYAALAAEPRNGLKAIRVDAFAWQHIDFNLRHPIVGDVQVRRALAYATDRAEIINKVAHGSAIPANTDQQPHYSWAYTDDIAHYPFDPAKAEGAARRGRLEGRTRRRKGQEWSASRVYVGHADRVHDGKSERDRTAAAVAGRRRTGRRQELSDQSSSSTTRRTAFSKADTTTSRSLVGSGPPTLTTARSTPGPT